MIMKWKWNEMGMFRLANRAVKLTAVHSPSITPESVLNQTKSLLTMVVEWSDFNKLKGRQLKLPAQSPYTLYYRERCRSNWETLRTRPREVALHCKSTCSSL